MSSNVLRAIQAKRLVNYLGKLFIADKIGICGHPAFGDAKVFDIELSGHYYAYAESDLTNAAFEIVLIYEDCRDINARPIEQTDVVGRSVIVTHGGVLIGRASVIDAVAQTLDGPNADLKFHNAIADALMTRDTISNGDVKINGHKPALITVPASGEFSVYAIRLRSSHKICGYGFKLCEA